MTLEATAAEVPVDQFSADIVATDAQSGYRVLIENQLEGSDHTHLGQILTYLAGLEAKTVVWVAPEFADAHRSAIRWLNEHTDDDFSFFAVRLRVVRIGDSPYAPVFEVVEKPNQWERHLSKITHRAGSENGDLRERFWQRYLALHPSIFKPSRHSNVWLPMLPDGSIVLSMYVGTMSGMFLRPRFGADSNEIDAFMAQNSERLDKVFGPSQMATPGYFYGTEIDISLQETERWNELIQWMEEKRCSYVDVLNSAPA